MTVIEAGPDRVKLAEFERTRSGHALARFVCVPVEAESRKTGAALAAAVTRNGFRRRGLTACLPRQLVNIRMLDLPSSERSEIAGMVDLQLGKQVPYSRDEVAVDWRVLGTPRDGYTRVMLVVVQRAVLREQFGLFEEAGLEVDRVTVSSEAVMHWLRCAGIEAKPGEAVVALDVDATATDLVVSAGGLLQFSRAIQVGAEGLGDAAAGRDRLLAEVRQALEICRAERPDLAIGRVVLTGALLADGDLAAWLGGQLEGTVDRMSAVSVLEGHPHGPDPTGQECGAVSLAAMIGVAVAGPAACLNLFPDSVRMRRTLMTRARGLTRFTILMLSLLFAGSLYASLKYTVRQRRLALLEQRLAVERPRTERILLRQDAARIVQQRRTVAYSALELIMAIHAATPQGVTLDLVDVDMARGRLSLRGVAVTRPDIRALIGNLEQAAWFRNVQEGGATTRDRSNRFRFQVEGGLEAAPTPR